VATVAINNAQNAGLLAARILGAGMPQLIDRVDEYMKEMEQEVEKKIERLDHVGWDAYQSIR